MTSTGDQSGAPAQNKLQAETSTRRLKLADAVLLALWWLILASVAVLWLRLDNRFPSGDTALRLTHTIEMARVLATPSLDWLSRIAAVFQGQPPLYAILTAPLIWLFGPAPISSCWLTWPSWRCSWRVPTASFEGWNASTLQQFNVSMLQHSAGRPWLPQRS